MVVICGAGKQVNTQLKNAGYYVWYDSRWERLICCSAAEKIVRNTLEDTRNLLQGKLWNWIYVKWSWEEIWWVYVHINADTLVMTYYLGFQEIFIFTFQWNGDKKRNIFEKYLKVQIIEL